MDPQSQTPQTQPVQPLQQPTSPVPAKKPSAKMLLLVLGFVIILIAIGTAYVLGARSNAPKPTQVVLTPTIAQPTPTRDPMGGWNTFTSNYFGFTQKYPADWINDNLCYQCPAQPVEDSSSERYFHPSRVKYPEGITYMINSKDGTSLAIMESAARNNKWEDQKIEDIMVDGYKGIKVLGKLDGIDSELAVFENKNFVFQISNHGGYKDILDKILTTFKFTNSSQAVDTSSWKTYTGNDFTFKYPADTSWSLNSLQGGASALCSKCELTGETVYNFEVVPVVTKSSINVIIFAVSLCARLVASTKISSFTCVLPASIMWVLSLVWERTKSRLDAASSGVVGLRM
jgi:hypothetical protein